MADVIIILLFVAVLGFPGFYLITRAVFKQGSRKTAFWFAGLATALLVVILTLLMAGVSL